MANTVIALKKSATPGSVPASLQFGELGINYADGKLFYKNTNNQIAEISGGGGGNYFGTVNANNTLIVADTPADVVTMVPGDNITIVGDAVNDKLTIGLSNDVVIPGLLTVSAASGDEGGEIKLANAITNSVLSGKVVIDIYQNKLRFFEESGTNRGAYINLASASTGVGTDLLASASATDTTARNWASAAFDQANTARTHANTAHATGNAAFNQANTARDHSNLAFSTANASNGWANTVASASAVAANTLSATRTDAANGWANTISATRTDAANGWANTISATRSDASNAYARTVGDAANAYARTVGSASNTYADTVGSGANSYARTVGSAGNTYTNTVGDAGNVYARTVGTAGNNYVDATFVKLSSPSQTITGNISITGSLSVSGNSYRIDANNLVVQDPLIYLAGNNYVSDIVDIGFIGNYVNATGQNVHTGLYREHEDKMYYLFQGYDQEPINNHIGAFSNNMTLAVLNADLKTSNLNLGGVNAISWIRSTFDTANAANGWANTISATRTNAANGWANTVASDSANAANTLSNIRTNAANGWANTVASASAVAANSYAREVGQASNTYALANTTGTFNGNLTVAGSLTTTSNVVSFGSAFKIEANGDVFIFGTLNMLN